MGRRMKEEREREEEKWRTQCCLNLKLLKQLPLTRFFNFRNAHLSYRKNTKKHCGKKKSKKFSKFALLSTSLCGSYGFIELAIALSLLMRKSRNLK